jgi:nitrogen fixation protein FixH
MSQGFTGRQMIAVMVSFFGLVIAVNFTMASLARDTFGGTVVDNSYVASQKYNGWLQAARDQKALPWQAEQALAADRHVLLQVTGDGSFVANGTAQHPLGRASDIPLSFIAGPDGTLRSTTPLPPGRWQVRTSVQRGSEVLRLAGTLQ